MTLYLGHEAPTVAAKHVEAFSGPRDWPYDKSVFHVLSGLKHPYGGEARTNLRVVFGDATGVDAHALNACKRLGIEHDVYPALWDAMAALGKPRSAAGPIRNGEILAIERPFCVRVFSYGRDNIARGPATRQVRPWSEILGKVLVSIGPGRDGDDNLGWPGMQVALNTYPLTRGTGDMAMQALAAGIPVIVHDIWGGERIWIKPRV